MGKNTRTTKPVVWMVWPYHDAAFYSWQAVKNHKSYGNVHLSLSYSIKLILTQAFMFRDDVWGLLT